MIHASATSQRWIPRGWSQGLAVGLALTLASCGGTSAKHHSHQHAQVGEGPASRSSANDGPPARIPPARPVALTATRPALLAVCLKNSLLRPICPRLGPLANEPQPLIQRLGFCITRAGRDLVAGGHYERLASSHCVDAMWGYEAIRWPPITAGKAVTISGWDPVTGLSAPAVALLLSPPVHVHIEIEASLGSLVLAPAHCSRQCTTSWPQGAHPVSDTLLSAKRTQPVSLGWVRWYGRYGQLVLEPVYPSGGEWGGHLIFRFTAGRVNYAITLHSWMPTIRITGAGVDRVIRFQSGPALPHVIATVKAIAGSALTG